MSELIENVRFAPRRGVTRTTWWGKAWQLAVEEATYSSRDLKQGRAWARAGKVGRISLGVREAGEERNGWIVAGVEVGDEVHSVRVAVAGLEPGAAEGLVEVVAAGAGRIGSLLAGDLPKDMVSDGEELGVELLPWSGDLAFTCSCEPWADPCPHAVAVATQAGWLMDADPFVLLTLRGTSREALLAALNARVLAASATDPDAGSDWFDDLTVAEEAALRVERALGEL